MASESSGVFPGLVAAVLAVAVAWVWVDGVGRPAGGPIAGPAVIEDRPSAPPRARGSLRGRVRWAGPLPEVFLPYGTPPSNCLVCRTASPLAGQCWERRADGGLSQALLWILSAPDDAPPEPKDALVRFRPCHFDPQVVAFRRGAALVLAAEDDDVHTCARANAKRNDSFNVVGIKRRGATRYAFEKKELGIQITRECHPFAAAWVSVFDRECFAISAPDGTFEIGGLAPGRRRLLLWHPTFVVQRREFEVNVSDSGVTTLDLTLP